MTQSHDGAGFWDERYGDAEYVYGRQANDFLRENAKLFKKGDAVLSLAEGEGRNGVFLAQRGCSVRGVDFSAAARAKALRLAQELGVVLEYDTADLADYDLGDNKWDGVVSIFCHPPAALRPALYASIRRALKPGGIFLLESYNKRQLAYDTGGPRDAAYLPSLDELRRAFDGFDVIRAQDLERNVQEGPHHSGLAAVTQFIARKAV